MFSVRQKREIADKLQQILRETAHPELPSGEIQFKLHVDGAQPWSWADICNNGAIDNPGINPYNEVMDTQTHEAKNTENMDVTLTYEYEENFDVKKVVLICDGGSRDNGNQSDGYGSWRIQDDHGKVLAEETEEFGIGVTNNEAEYRSLHQGIAAIFLLYPEVKQVEVRTDSALLIGQLVRGWTCNHMHLQQWIDKINEQLRNIEDFHMTKISGVEMKQILGH